MEKILFIINPIAGGGKARSLVPTIERVMKDKEIKYDIILTKKPKDATRISKSGLEKGYTKIVAVGGDGTINEVALSLLGSDKATLGIVPSGTGNDLVRALNIPFDPKEAIDIILKGIEKKIDVGTVNDKLFLNISSIGFDSEVAKNTETIKKKLKSSISYAIGLLITLFKFKNINVKLEIDDFSIDEDVLLVAVGNGKYYGGGFKILPMAILEDGFFHICLVKKMSKLKLLFLLSTILTGEHINQKEYVKIFKAKNIKITTQDETFLNIDGEIKRISEEITFTIQEGKLPVFIGA